MRLSKIVLMAGLLALGVAGAAFAEPHGQTQTGERPDSGFCPTCYAQNPDYKKAYDEQNTDSGKPAVTSDADTVR